MKYLIVITLLTLVFFQSFGQRNPDVKVGLGMPFFLGNTSGTEVNKLSGFPNVWIEKPIPIIIDRDEKISFSPGLSFSVFNEKEEIDKVVSEKSSNLNHYSLNGYTKLFYNLLLQRRSEAFVYFGGIVGAHITTRTIGTVKTISVGSGLDEEKDIKKSGRDFYNTIYFGAILGFQPDMKITNRIAPSFEISFLPNFVTRLNDEKTNTIQFTVLLGINN